MYFLDVNVYKGNDFPQTRKLYFSTYINPQINSFMYMHSLTTLLALKKGIFIGETKKLLRTNSEKVKPIES